MGNLKQQADGWSSNYGFLISAIASAVGLGNLWRFPYLAGTHGGGAFIFIYLLSVSAIVIPILIAEIMLGRKAGIGGVQSMAINAQQENRTPAWGYVGWLFVGICFLMLAFYNLVGGWVLDYLGIALQNGFDKLTPEQSTAQFAKLLQDPVRMIISHSVIMIMCVGIVSFGIKNGVERASKIMMILLVTILIFLIFYGAIAGDFKAATTFLFHVDFSKIDIKVAITAIGQSFLSGSIGAGVLMTYGSYLKREISIPRAAIIIISADTLIAIMAGLVIFPFVFKFGLEPNQGVGLIFETLPIAFGQMPYSFVPAGAFFLLLLFAALTSFVALLEVVTHALKDRFKIGQKKSALIVGFLAWFIGIASIFSFNIWRDVQLFNWLGVLSGKNIFNSFDYLLTNVLLIVGGLCIAIFAGWCIKKSTLRNALQFNNHHLFSVWHFCLKFIIPVILLAVLIANNIG